AAGRRGSLVRFRRIGNGVASGGSDGPRCTPKNTEPRMESRYAQERLCSSCRPRFARPAANRVRGIVGFIGQFGPDCDVGRPAGRPGDQRSAEQRATTRLDRAACSEVCHRLGARHGQRQVVYAYDKDPKGGTPACTGSCAKIWLPVTGGHPVASPADKGLGTLGTVTTANG